MSTFEGINSVELQGELAWPELKYTGSGKALLRAKIRIPTSDQRTGDSRESFIRVVAWEEIAEYINELEPRSRLRVTGRIQERSFTNREGRRQNITEIVLDGVEPVDTEEGINRFFLRGSVKWPELKEVGESNTPLYHAKVVVPFYRDEALKHSYIRITAWNDLAEALNASPEVTVVEVSAHIQERTWTNPQGQKRIFTDAVVTNYVTVEGATASV